MTLTPSGALENNRRALPGRARNAVRRTVAIIAVGAQDLCDSLLTRPAAGPGMQNVICARCNVLPLLVPYFYSTSILISCDFVRMPLHPTQQQGTASFVPRLLVGNMYKGVCILCMLAASRARARRLVIEAPPMCAAATCVL